jgi:hypothetical protein
MAGLAAALAVSASTQLGRPATPGDLVASAVRPRTARDRAPRQRVARRRAKLAELDVVSEQPSVIYADARAFSFNTGFASTVRPDLLASFEKTGTDAATDDGAWEVAFAKTVTFFFAPDSANTRVQGAFALWREVNDAAPRILVRNVLPDTLPFFVYKCAGQDPAGDSLAEVPAERLPITFADSTEAGIDAQSIRAVELHFLVTNGERGAAQKLERVSVVAMLPGPPHEVQPARGEYSRPAAGLAALQRRYPAARVTQRD